MSQKTLRMTSTIIGAASALMLLVAGCSSPADPAAQPAASTGPSSSNNAPVQSIDELAEGSEHEPPSEGPSAAEDKSVWVISCGKESEGCAQYYDASREAAAELGWDYHEADGKMNVAGGYASAIRSALAASPDAIVIGQWSCDSAEQALQEAKQQGVPVMNVEGFDCAGNPLFTIPHKYNETAGTSLEYWQDFARRNANYIIERTGGNAKVISHTGPDELQRVISSTFEEEMAKCSGCEIVETIDAAGTDMVPNGPWIQNFRTTLIQNPDANAVFIPFDSMMSVLGGAQAIQEAGRRDDMLLVGGIGERSSGGMIRDGAVTSLPAAVDIDFKAWAAMDNLNRYFHNEPAVPQGSGFVLVDGEHDALLPPAGEPVQTEIDFRSAYRELWGAGQ